MNDDSKKQFISRYVDGEVTPEEARQVETWLQEDESLRAYEQELRRLSQILNDLPQEGTSPDWEHKIQRKLTDVEEQEGRQMNRLRSYRMAGSVLMVLIVGVVGLRMYAERTIQRTVQGRLREAPDYLDGGSVSTVPMAEGKSENAPASSQVQQLASLRRDSEKYVQYEPYYLEASNFSQSRKASGRKMLARRAGEAVSYPSVSVIEDQTFGENVSAIDAANVDRLRYNPNFNTEEYARIYENQFLEVIENPLSTFSIDVDTASYSNIRRFLNNNQLPPPDAVRIEEMINYFDYDYPQPEGDIPFSITIQGAVCPWNKGHYLVQIGLQGKILDEDNLPPSNLVFLIDVSGSMQPENKLPLLKKALKKMVTRLSENERVAIVVYAGNAGEVLPSTPASHKKVILDAIDRLEAGGSTAGGAGIKLAYKIAKRNFILNGNNRVILATDGDFNVGASSDAELVRLIEEKRKEGIFLTVLGFGMGNYKDSKMEQLADKGNGNYYYIDTEREAEKVLVHELGSTLFTIAKDVKVQIEFNPQQVKGYRLIGYENRVLAKEDFNDDTKDAGELGAGHTVTALYEIVPADSNETFQDVDELTFQKRQVVPSDDMMLVKLRYKKPDENVSTKVTQRFTRQQLQPRVQGDLQFAAAVAQFGLILRDSAFKGTASYERVIEDAQAAMGQDPYGYRAEFIDLVRKARSLDNRQYEENAAGGSIQFKGY